VTNRKKVPYPELRPGVKVCATCGEEFHLTPEPNQHERTNWPTRRFCTVRCRSVAKARRERERFRAKGITRPYKDKPQPKPERVYDMRHSHQPRQMDALKALPPEARTASVKEALQRAAETHEEFLSILVNVTQERRGFKTRVRNYIRATRRESSARS
jgi:hypothetical protein